MGKEFWKSACSHDCPSACSLEVERLSSTRIGRVRGAAANTYADGVVCAKVARCTERVHHPDRLKQPRRRAFGYGGLVGGRLWTPHQEGVKAMRQAFGVDEV